MSVMDESTCNDPNAAVTKKRQKTESKTGHHGPSGVWNHFNKHFKEGTTKYLGEYDCKYCQNVILTPSTQGTNSLWHYLKGCKNFHSFEGDKNQPLISFSGAGGQPSAWRFDQEKCRKSLAKMIIIDELLFSHVEKEGFRSFCGEMQPKFHVISRTTVTKDIIGIFNEEKKKLKGHMKE
ncbi:hypothetical protein GIB67_040145 [Kingdonia uniflora]|uniref:BED-type domain-containing protein n=1 Tax=Kingdonia uniflora TaxID=39325 RepID=A0A7J7MUM2_9MAGN|nr:hypothetical protein GIB67_040145 [Kingdonia uniflora]